MFFTFAIFTTVAVAQLLMLKAWHPEWWRRRWVKRAAVALIMVGIAGISLRLLGLGSGGRAPVANLPRASIVGAALAGPASVFALMLLWSLPLAALVRRVGKALIGNEARGVESTSTATTTPTTATATKSTPTTTTTTTTTTNTNTTATATATATPTATAGTPGSGTLIRRRAWLEGVAAAVPVAALGTGGVGLVGAYQATQVVRRPMRFEGLPAGLRGLRILQLTDLHLGAFIDPKGVEDIVERARLMAPDLVVVTGDFSDHVAWLPGALEAVGSLAPRLGAFAVLGNHEHFRDPDAHRRAFDKSSIELLVDRHVTIPTDGSSLTIVGVDDPGHGASDDYYARASDRALDGSPGDSFKLALCHRPSGFRQLAARKADLTLSGHTHGAQVGVGGRSVLEPLWPEARLLGRYAIGKSQLYTSSGAGHWFAFRLNCPSEAALIELEEESA